MLLTTVAMIYNITIIDRQYVWNGENGLVTFRGEHRAMELPASFGPTLLPAGLAAPPTFMSYGRCIRVRTALV